MSKNKLAKFAEMKTFSNVFQPDIRDLRNINFELKGRWHKDYFKNDNPIVLELGCGKAEYTVAFAEKYPDKNFVAVDIKGARVWQGAKIATTKKLKNAAFLRTKIDLIASFFDKDEVSEIWIPFPDPQLRKQRKRLTSPMFLNRYRQFLKNNSTINLKTDNRYLHDYTAEMLKQNGIKPIVKITDLYNSDYQGDVRLAQTYYEKKFIADGLKITYLQFKISNTKELVDIDFPKFEGEK